MPNTLRLPESKFTFSYEDETSTFKGDKEVYTHRRGGYMMKQVLEQDFFGNWIEDDGTLYGRYQGKDNELEGTTAEIDLGSYLDPDNQNATKLLVPK